MDWIDHPGYAAFFDWIGDHVTYLSSDDAESIVDGLWERGMPPPSMEAMSALAKWASTFWDNVADLRTNAHLRDELKQYTRAWGLDQIESVDLRGHGGSAYDHPIHRAIEIPIDVGEVEGIVEGASNLEIERYPAESWSLNAGAAENFLRSGRTGVVLSQPSPVPGSLIWNFTNPVLGYEAFRSEFSEEYEVITESQCSSCTFEEILKINFRLSPGEEVEEAERLQDALDRKYRVLGTHSIPIPDSFPEVVGSVFGILRLMHDRRQYIMGFSDVYGRPT